MNFLEKIFTSKSKKEKQEKISENIEKFNKFISAYKDGDMIYVRDKTDDTYGYLCLGTESYYKMNGYVITIHTMDGFPSRFEFDDWTYINVDLDEFFTDFEVIPKETIDAIIKKHKDEISNKIFEVAKQIKCGSYHNKMVEPHDSSYLMTVNRVFKSNDSYYAEVVYSDLLNSYDSKPRLKLITLDFFGNYEEGDGVENI